MTTIIINVAKGEDELDTIRQVAKLMEDGYSSGFDPAWDILNDDVEVVTKKINGQRSL